ncbi:uncharacterized protein FA14DRAFT_157318 [Meira miltonrushii]|uniref:A to I editase domain-containing protein n=1 Tax=Meira miltonrushii TaxID=1280837 RepID=A0A316V577_9BASI|nr:uncharacterized protein FA14DRAFT_157318 [Meira miltonrushii]PWN32612.1 hypothetical protein FA14DRAFT_157318 [Meira miltonrushii]
MDHADQIARLCLQQYNSFGKGGAKPRIRQDGRYEWTVLAGIVLSVQSEWHCIALATGVKALPFSHLSKHGDLLHDSHAEVLARRAARHWLLQRLLDENDDLISSHLKGIPRIFVRNDNRFGLIEDAHLHLYCSTLPCGDLSSSLIADEKHDNEAPSPTVLRGRTMSSSTQTHIRTKPGRPDAEPSISMSCSDKIAHWTLMGIQGALLYGIIGKVSLQSYVIGNQAFPDQADALEKCQKMLRRKCGNGPIPQIAFATLPFLHSRESVQEDLLNHKPDACVSGPSDERDLVPSANSLVWCLGAKPQGIVEGHRQGAALRRSAGEPLRQSSRSTFCKLDWFRFVCDAKKRLDMQLTPNATYSECKEAITEYRNHKDLLRGLSGINSLDRPAYQQQSINAFLGQQSFPSPSLIDSEAPFAGWLVSSHSLEQFNHNGHEIVQ